MTCVEPIFIEPFPVLAFFHEMIIPSPEQIDAPLVVRTHTAVPSGKQLRKKG